jgi:hypothetical protein
MRIVWVVLVPVVLVVLVAVALVVLSFDYLEMRFVMRQR